MFTKEDYNSLPIDVVVNLINQLEEERDMYRDKWREVGKMYGTTRNEINMQNAKNRSRLYKNVNV